MKQLMESWRGYLDEAENESLLKELFRHWAESHGIEFNGSPILEEALLESWLGDKWQQGKAKLQQMKGWGYEQYLKVVKPMIIKVKDLIGKLKEAGWLKKYPSRALADQFEMLGTKKYIKLGYIILSAVVGIIVDNVFAPKKAMEVIKAVIGALKKLGTTTGGKLKKVGAGVLDGLCSLLSIPCDELMELTGLMKTFGADMQKTGDIFSGEKIGQGEFELAESLVQTVDIKI